MSLANKISRIERWLVPRSALSGPASFRMDTTLALSLAFAGGSLALGRFERYRLAASMLSGTAGAIEMFALFSGLTGIDTLYDGVHYRVPPLLASIGLLCITGGIMLRIGTVPEFRIPQPLWRLLTMFGCAIVGAGIGGLTAAIALCRRGVNVAINIRDDGSSKALPEKPASCWRASPGCYRGFVGCRANRLLAGWGFVK